MTQLLTNLRWIPRLCILAMTNKVGIRVKQGHEYVFIQTPSEATKNNGIVRVEI